VTARRIELITLAQPYLAPKRDRKKPAVVRRKQAKLIARIALAQPSLLESSQYLYRTAQGLPKGLWRTSLGALARVLSGNRRPFSVFIPDGNVKLPFVTFSTLPLFTCPGKGSCARYCYSLGSWRYPGSFCRQLQNTLFMRVRREQIEEAFCDIPAGQTLRLYVDGDFEDAEQFGWWMGLLARRPDLNAYGYSKSWDVIADYVRQAGKVPDNYALNLSTGGRPQKTSAEELLALPFVRGWFKVVNVDWHPSTPTAGNVGFAKFEDPHYHQLVRQAAPGAFSCPGKCGDCHKCGDRAFNRDVAIGIH
jgi:hypothetical protein